MATHEMTFLGKVEGVNYYWAEPGKFEEPGIYYWDEHRAKNVRLRPVPTPQAVENISDGYISEVTLDEVGKWPSFEAQSWACKVVKAVVRVLYGVNPFDTRTVDKGPWRAAHTSDERAYLESAMDHPADVLLRIDGNFPDLKSKMVYAQGIADQLNGKADTSVDAFMRELESYAPKDGQIVAPTALMGIGIKARMLRVRMKKSS